MRRGSSRARHVAALGAPALLAATVRLWTGPHPVDDAYITFRYARNLATGVGLVYNPGEWVLGTTTPLWAMLLGALYRLGLTDLPTTATVLSALFDGASAVLLAFLGLRLGLGAFGAAALGAAWAMNPLSVAFAVGGMETSLFVLCTLGVLTIATAGRFTTAAGLAALVTLVRPEGVLLAAIAVGWGWWSTRRLPVRPLLVAGAILAVIAVALVSWYGSPLPQSMLAKRAAYRVGAPWTNLLTFAFQAGLPGWSSFLAGALPAVATVAVAAVGLGTLGVLGHAASRWLVSSRSLPWPPFAAFVLAYVGAYSLAGLRDVRLFPWYLVPVVPFYLLASGTGLTSLGGRRAGWLVAGLVLWQLPAIDWRQPFLPTGFDLRREALYRQVGQDLATQLPPGSVVAAPEIGAVGYASRLRMLDTVGLVSPEAVPYYPLPSEQLVSDNAIPARLIEDTAPDAVVALDEFARLSLLPDPAFQRRYRLANAYPTAIWRSRELLVYRRLDEPREQP